MSETTQAATEIDKKGYQLYKKGQYAEARNGYPAAHHLKRSIRYLFLLTLTASLLFTGQSAAQKPNIREAEIRHILHQRLGVKPSSIRITGLVSEIGTIEPFSNVYGIHPGVERLQRMVGFLGTPDAIEFQPDKNAEEAEPKGRYLIKYNYLGLIAVLDNIKMKTDNPMIDAIVVKNPSRGKTLSGVHIGMRKEQALKKLKQHYHLDSKSINRLDRKADEIYWFHRAKDKKPKKIGFTIWIRQGHVSKMRVTGP